MWGTAEGGIMPTPSSSGIVIYRILLPFSTASTSLSPS